MAVSFGLTRHDTTQWRTQPHDFEESLLTLPTWCDVCEDVVWGLFKPCVQCKKCGYVAHSECQQFVAIACEATKAKRSSETSNIQDQQRTHPKAALPDVHVGSHGLLAYLSTEDVKKKVVAFNAAANKENIDLIDDGDGKQFKGYIRVTLNLTRPIRVASSDLSPYFNNQSPEGTETTPTPSPALTSCTSSSRFFRSSSSSGGSSGPLSPFDTETSFYLPKNVSKGLFVTSATTSQEVISILLRKFKVVSNPRKFALYETDLQSGSKRRLRRFEEPLALKLLWGGDNTNLILSLEEFNRDDHFNWAEFTQVELENFLKILIREEEEATELISRKFEKEKEDLLARIALLEAP